MTKLFKWLVKGSILLLVLLVTSAVAALFYLHFGDLNPYKDKLATYLSEELKREIILAGDIDIDIANGLRVMAEKVAISNAFWGKEKHLLEIGKIDVSAPLLPLLSSKFVIESLEVKDLSLIFDSKDGVSNWDFNPGAIKPKKDSDDPKIPYIKITKGFIENLLIKIHGQDDKLLKIEIANGKIKEWFEKLNLDVSGAYNENKIALVGETVSLDSLLNKHILKKKPLPLDAEIKTDKFKLKGDGKITITNPLLYTNLNLLAFGPNLKDIEKIANIDLPDFEHINIKTKLLLKDKSISLTELDSKIGFNDFSGDFAFSWGSTPKNFTTTLKSIRVDLEEFLSAFPKKAKEQETAKEIKEEEADKSATEEVEETEGFNLEKFLIDYTIDANLEVAKFIASEKLALDNLLAKVFLQNGQLTISPFEAGFFDGLFSGQIEASSKDDVTTASVKLDSKKFNLGECFDSLDIDGGIKCIADSNISLQTTGKTKTELISNLNGSVNLYSEYGELTNNMLKVASVGLGDILGPLFEGRSDVKVHCLHLEMNVEKGILKSSESVMHTEVVTAFVEGDIDLNKNDLDLDVYLKTTNPSLASLAPPFSVSGPFKDISYVPSVKGAAVDIAKSGVVVVDSVAGTLKDTVTSTAEILIGIENEEIEGLDLCRKAIEQKDDLFPGLLN